MFRIATPTAEQIEAAACAVYNKHHAKECGPWDAFKVRKPDIADIYRDNVRTAINVYRRTLDRIGEPESKSARVGS